MKKISRLLMVFVLALVMGLGVLGGCSNAANNKKGDGDTNPQTQDPGTTPPATQDPDTTPPPTAIDSKRYIATPVEFENEDGEIQNYRLDYSFKFMDEEDLTLYDAYYIYLGKVEETPIASGTSRKYDGIPFTMTYSTTQTTQGSITESIATAVTNSTQTLHSDTETKSKETSTEVTWITDVIKTTFKNGYNHSWTDSTAITDQTSRTDTYTTYQGWSVSNTESVTFTIGNNSEPYGFYRYSLFATCDVYVAVIHDLKDDQWAYEYSAFARPGTFYEGIDYCAENRFLSSTEDGTILEFDTATINTLSVIPSRSYIVQFVSNGTTIKTETVTYGSFATPPADPTSDTQNFTGWSPNIIAPITENKTFTAQWKDKEWKTYYSDSKGVAVMSSGGWVSFPIPLDIAKQTGKTIPSYNNSVRLTFNILDTPAVLSSSANLGGIFDYTFINGIFTFKNTMPSGIYLVTKIEYLV